VRDAGEEPEAGGGQRAQRSGQTGVGAFRSRLTAVDATGPPRYTPAIYP
jgi:hypothetical protein